MPCIIFHCSDWRYVSLVHLKAISQCSSESSTFDLFAKNVRNDKNIRGISIPGAPEPVKIRQYADDTTLFLRDLIDYREILATIKIFTEATGLKLNKMKSNAIIYISDPNQNNTYKNGIKFVNKLKTLVITFSNELRHN